MRLNYCENIEINTDDAVVKLQVSLATWAPEGNIRLLRTRAAELAKAVEGWGTCEVSEVSGDVFAGYCFKFIRLYCEQCCNAFGCTLI